MLRYLTDAWRTLDRSLPDDVYTPTLEDVVEWLGAADPGDRRHAARRVDAPRGAPRPRSPGARSPAAPWRGRPPAWRTAVRTAAFGWVELLASRSWRDAGRPQRLERGATWRRRWAPYWAEYDAHRHRRRRAQCGPLHARRGTGPLGRDAAPRRSGRRRRVAVRGERRPRCLAERRRAHAPTRQPRAFLIPFGHDRRAVAADVASWWRVPRPVATRRRSAPSKRRCRAHTRPGGGTGRRGGLKPPWWQHHAGSIPAPGTSSSWGNANARSRGRCLVNTRHARNWHTMIEPRLVSRQCCDAAEAGRIASMPASIPRVPSRRQTSSEDIATRKRRGRTRRGAARPWSGANGGATPLLTDPSVTGSPTGPIAWLDGHARHRLKAVVIHVVRRR